MWRAKFSSAFNLILFFLAQIEIKNGETGKTEMRPCFNLDDLMESLQMISVYGAGVPFTMDGTPMIRYYNPSLSGIGIYLNSSDPQTWIR